MIEEPKKHPPFYQWLDSEPWKKSKSIGLTGLKGSSKAYLLSLWRERIRKPPLSIVPFPRGAIQKGLPPQDLSESTLSLAVGDEVDRDQFVQFLQKGGYTSVRIVEER